MKKIDKTTQRRFGVKNTGAIYKRRRKITTEAQTAMSRSEILDEIWAAEKHTYDGEWYVRLSDVCAILGEDYARKDK